MNFGTIPLGEAEGAILAHAIRHASGVFKKGRRLSAEDVAVLEHAGLTEVIAARLGEHDLGEDEAASAVARAITGDHAYAAEPFTGRANLFAETRGLAVIDVARVDEINLLHESLTIATVPHLQVVEEGQMLATAKVIPFAADKDVVARAVEICGAQGLVKVAPLVAHGAGLVLTVLPQTRDAILDKSVAAISSRLEQLGSRLDEVIRCGHDAAAVADAIERLAAKGCSPILVFGASAIVDRGDVIPDGLARSGGEVVHLGMPVDPGNLMMLGQRGETPVIGVPSCARSPKLNGFDWVLQRVLAKVPVNARDIMLMGAGGLLKEIPSRPTPRSGRMTDGPRAPAIAAIILAAGQSRRMGKANKLLADIDGKPMVRHAAEAVIASRASPVVVVTGHESEEVRRTLDGLEVTFVDNPDYAEGLSTSLAAGIAALPEGVDGAVVCLGDMPMVEPAHVNRLISAFDPEEGRAICVPVTRGKRGNPVLWGADYFDEMTGIKGDVGAKHLLGQYSEAVCEVEIEGEAVLTDIDTPEALRKFVGQDQ